MHCHAAIFLFPETGLSQEILWKEKRQYFHMIVLSGRANSLSRILWLSKTVTNITSFLDIWDQNVLYLRDLGKCHSIRLGITLEISVISRYNWVKQSIIFIHRLNKLLSCLQSKSLCSLVKQCRTNLAQIICFLGSSSKICLIVFLANFEFLFHHLKIHLTISWNQFPVCFSNVRSSSGCWHPLHLSSLTFS